MSEFRRQNLKKRQRNKLKELHNEAPVLFREKYKNVSDNNSLSQLAADSSLGEGAYKPSSARRVAFYKGKCRAESFRFALSSSDSLSKKALHTL